MTPEAPDNQTIGLPGQCDLLERSHQGLFQLSLHPGKNVVCLRPGHGGLVVPMLNQRGEDIGNGQHSNDIGDALGTKRIRISAAIEILVMMPDSIQDLGGNACVSGNRILPPDASR